MSIERLMSQVSAMAMLLTHQQYKARLGKTIEQDFHKLTAEETCSSSNKQTLSCTTG
jgi:hypothetical protein